MTVDLDWLGDQRCQCGGSVRVDRWCGRSLSVCDGTRGSGPPYHLGAPHTVTRPQFGSAAVCF